MILVTGGAGLLGHTLINKLLEQNKKVVAITNNSTITIAHPNLTILQVDILDVCALDEVMQNISTVYHCAGLVSFNPADEKKLFSINVEGTANVVNAALQNAVKKLVHVSSVAALAKYTNGQFIDEKSEWNAESNSSKYGYSKYLAELEVWRAHAEGLPVVVVNPSIILGAGNWLQGSTRLFKTVYDEFAYYTEGSTGFVDVEDVASIMIQLMDSDVDGEKFIVTAVNTTYKNIFTLIANGFNKKNPSKKVSALLAAIAWRLAAIKSKFKGEPPLITRETAQSSLSTVQYNNNKLFSYLPNFTYKNIDESISHICKKFKDIYNL